MSAAEIKPIPVNSNLPSASGEAAPPEAAVGLPAHPIYEIEPEALEFTWSKKGRSFPKMPSPRRS
jgi:hypothetical protein